MAIEFICPGCNHCRIESPEDIEDGLCTFCLQRRDFPSNVVALKRHYVSPTLLLRVPEVEDIVGPFCWFTYGFVFCGLLATAFYLLTR